MAELIGQFTSSGAPSSGLANAPEITIRRTDTQAIVVGAVAMTEIGGGSYSYSFTPDAELNYTVLVDGDPNSTGQVDGRYLFGSLSGSRDDTVSRIKNIDKRSRNRKSLNKTTGVHTVYDDDGTTVLEQTQAYSDDNFTTTYDGSDSIHSEEPI